MLILVAVTINLSADGGLFAKSRKATRDTEEQAIYDQIVSAMELKDDGKIKPRDTFESFKNKFGEDKITEKDGNTASKIVFTVKGARDTYTYTITEDEIVIGEIKEPNDYDILKTYFLGADGNGRNLDDILDEDDNWKDDPTTDINESTLNSHYGADDGTIESYIIKYNNAIYELTFREMEDPAHPEDSTYYYGKSIELNQIYKQNLNSREGKDLGEVTGDSQYNGWTILYDNGSYVEAVSPSAMGELGIGYDRNLTDENLKIDSAITAYDNAIETINNYCKNLSNLPTNNGVRSVGAETDNTNTYCNLDPLTKKWWSEDMGFKIENRGKNKDDYYKQDVFRMIYYNIETSKENEKYYIASRCVEDYEDELYMGIRTLREDWELKFELRNTCIFSVRNGYSSPIIYSDEIDESEPVGVRPIIKVEI